MNKLIGLIEKMKPFFEKVSRNPYLRAIRDGFVSCIPVVLFSSLFILVACVHYGKLITIQWEYYLYLW